MGSSLSAAWPLPVIHQALDLGMTLIDTADVYGQYTNEELVGRALSDGRRDRAVIADNAGGGDLQLSAADLPDLADLADLPAPVGARY
jgi:aryl-alcohol dehydrogenase-like predicted oxidoreductase